MRMNPIIANNSPSMSLNIEPSLPPPYLLRIKNYWTIEKELMSTCKTFYFWCLCAFLECT